MVLIIEQLSAVVGEPSKAIVALQDAVAFVFTGIGQVIVGF